WIGQEVPDLLAGSVDREVAFEVHGGSFRPGGSGYPERPSGSSHDLQPRIPPQNPEIEEHAEESVTDPQSPNIPPPRKDQREDAAEECRRQRELHVRKMYQTKENRGDRDHEWKRQNRSQIPDDHRLHQ